MMRVSRLLLLTTLALLALAACSSNEEGRGGGNDASVSLPDARVIVPSDAGRMDASPLPEVKRITPASGTEVGGTRVVLRGSAFAEPAEVTFGGVPATSVVVLDDLSIAATTPPHPPGAVDVKVTTSAGVDELAAGFRYHRDLVLSSVSPERVPDRGGVPITIVGRGFDADTLVFFDRRPLLGARLVDAEHIDGFVPALSAGRPEIRVMHREAEVRRSDLLVVFATPRPRALSPGYGPTSGGATTVSGDGLSGATGVSIGGRAATLLAAGAAGALQIRVPALAEGAHDVRVDNADASGRLEGGYLAFDPASPGLALVGASPRFASSAGGDAIAIVGRGLESDMVVTIGGRAAVVGASTPPNILNVRVPSGLGIGPQPVVVRSRNGTRTASLAAALETFASIAVTAIDPSSGPAAGGTEVMISGSGFVDGVNVRVGDVPLADVVVESPTLIRGRTGPGAHGGGDIVVEGRRARGTLERGFRFEDTFALIRVDPAEGSVAGNTYLSVFGRGLDPSVSVKLGAVDAREVSLENGSIIAARTPASSSRRVDVVATAARGGMTFPDAFTYYDPRLLTGGAWGGPIEGSVNVAVVEPGSGAPIPGVTVQLGNDADPRHAGVTDMNGLVTISSPEIRGAQTVTAGKNEFEFVTFTELVSRNLTVFSSPYPSSPPPDAPISPCPTGGEPPRIRGHVRRVKSSLDPVTSPGWVPVVRVTYSQATIFNANPALPAEQADFVFEDGGAYEIVALRSGLVAVYAILYDYNQETQTLIPRKLGVARQVPANLGLTTEPVDIELDIALNKSLSVTLDDPPLQSGGSTVHAVFPFLNLGSEGVIAFPPSTVPSGPVLLERLPEIAESQFFYMGGSFTGRATGGLGAPYSLSLYETGQPFEDGLELGPFLGMPENVEPKPDGVLRGGRFSWEEAGPTPDITTIAVLDVKSISGCCCVDLNKNGQCESLESRQCGSFPQQFTRWSLYAQGGHEAYVLPRTAPSLRAFDSPQSYFWTVEQALAPRFDWREFTYLQFSPFFWKSWTVWDSTFISKEETLPP